MREWHTRRIVIADSLRLSGSAQGNESVFIGRKWTAVGLGIAALVAGCAPTQRSALPPLPGHPNGQALWHIVDQKCVPGQMRSADPSPCALAVIADGREHGYALLKDRVGFGQFLVMPTILITGIEDPRLDDADAADYFTPAWHARHRVATQSGLRLEREDVGIAVNSLYGRTQDLLHLHVDCMRQDVRDTLKALAPRIGRTWSSLPQRLAGHAYQAIRIDGDNGVEANPFHLVRDGLRVRRQDMGRWTILLTGARFTDGPGFILLAASADPAHDEPGSVEILMDHKCEGRAAA